MRRRSIGLVVVLLLGIVCPIAAQNGYTGKKIVINELVATNLAGHADERGDREDWIELYNPTNKPVDLLGLYLSDDLSKPPQFRFEEEEDSDDWPDYRKPVAPLRYAIIILDWETDEGPYHADMRLKEKGESIYLIDRDGKTVLDSITFPKQYENISYGRDPENSAEWKYLDTPTPGAKNSPSSYVGAGEKIEISHKSGFYSGEFDITISCEADHQIVYTTDGSKPTLGNSEIYDGPIKIDTNIVIRARTLDSNLLPGSIKTKHFFVDQKQTIPVVSIVADPDELFDYRHGLFSWGNHRSRKTRDGHAVLIMDSGEVVFSKKMFIKLQGRFARRFDKKSMTIMPQKGRIEYPLFLQTDIADFDGFILRADCNYAYARGDGKRTAGERIKNELMYAMNQQMNTSVRMQSFRPVEVYINGEYFGLYNMVERKNKELIEHHYGYTDIDLLNPAVQRNDEWRFEVYAGDKNHMTMVMNYLKKHSMADQDHYEKVKEWLDIENLVDCWIMEIYTGKGDDNSNTRMWRPREEGGKWQNISFDHDHWKSVSNKSVTKFIKRRPRGKSWMFNRLIKNEEFKTYFVNRFCDWFNYAYRPQNMHHLIDSIDATVFAEKLRDRNYWEDEIDYVEVGEHVAWLKDFSNRRPDTLRTEMTAILGVGEQASITVEKGAGGKVQVNTLLISEDNWTGIYFEGLPFTIVAIPDEGYKFVRWEYIKSKKGSSPSRLIKLRGDLTVKAVFKKV